eukprot:5401578-Amphidinium_carterae.2
MSTRTSINPLKSQSRPPRLSHLSHFSGPVLQLIMLKRDRHMPLKRVPNKTEKCRARAVNSHVNSSCAVPGAKTLSKRKSSAPQHHSTEIGESTD